MNKYTQMFSPSTNWCKPEWHQIPDIKNASVVAVDLETKDTNLRTLGSGAARNDGYIVGIAIAIDGWKGYFPLCHESGGNMESEEMVWKWFDENVAKTESTKVFHNAMYDVSWLRSKGVKLNGTLHDTMMMASLVDENRYNYSLNKVAYDYIGMTKQEKELMESAKIWGVDAKAEMWRMPADSVGKYAQRDAEVTLELWKSMQHHIQQEQVENIFKIETDLFPCLVDMKFKGVRFDTEKAEKLKKEFKKAEEAILQGIKKATGVDVDIWAAASLQKVFDKLKIKYDKTEKGNPSFTKGFLAEHSNPLLQSINTAREFNKARGTFIDSLIKHEHNGRVHAEINQLRSDEGGTVTGRFSYSNPNLQQIPAHHEIIGPAIRSLFLPEEGCKWGCFDYSQQEPRILVHFAVAAGIKGADELSRKYANPEADFHKMVAELAQIKRKQAKTINLGIMYGMGKNKLKGELGLTDEESEEIWKKYHDLFPIVGLLTKRVQNRAAKKGSIRTLAGRKCRFNYYEPYGFNAGKPILGKEKAEEAYGEGQVKRAFTYRALNKLIQGSAADQTKIAMLALYREGVIPHVQIHDELDISVSSVQESDRIIRIMEEAPKLSYVDKYEEEIETVPNKVDYEEGDTWGDIHG